MAGVAPLTTIQDIVMAIDLPIEFDSSRTKAQHISDHLSLHETNNRLRWVEVGDDLQSEISAGGVVTLAPGVHQCGALTISKDTVLIGQPGAELQTTGMIASPTDGAYLDVAIRDIKIVGGGAGTGLRLDSCKASVDRVTVVGFETGLDIEYAIHTSIAQSRLEGSINALHVGGRTSTTLVLSACYLRNALVAAKIEANTTDITFFNCIFENSQRGMEADGIANLSLYSPYFEACYQEQLVIGASALVSSFTMINPIMMGHADNNPEVEMCVFDNVRDVTWMNGYCVVPKTTLIQTTLQSGNVFMIEPYNVIGSVRDIATPERAIILLRDGYMQCQQLRSDTWSIFQGYNYEPGDMSIGTGAHLAMYATPDGRVRIAGDTISGLKHGLEVDDYSITLTRESDQTRWMYKVGVDGTLLVEQIT